MNVCCETVAIDAGEVLKLLRPRDTLTRPISRKVESETGAIVTFSGELVPATTA